PSSEGDITCADVYRFTLEDLYCALKAMKASDPTVNYFREFWYYPITLVADAFDLDRACGAGEENVDLPEKTKKYPGLNLLDSDHFSKIWEQLGTACGVENDEMPLSEAFSFDEKVTGAFS
ncbi:MAG: hypothetical protein II189_03100, partial [Lachnospiraceae bacterium]|nr:hypothetical protein [Lachnospiraceae bacterium]